MYMAVGEVDTNAAEEGVGLSNVLGNAIAQVAAEEERVPVIGSAHASLVVDDLLNAVFGAGVEGATDARYV